MFIQRHVLVKVMSKACELRDMTHSMLFLFAYTFLLRVPSECLPVVKGCDGYDYGDKQSVVFVYSDRIVLRLLKRKNKLGGSTISRHCWCRHCPMTCPVHVLGKYVQDLPSGSSPFAGISSGQACDVLRRCLELAGVESADKYRCHDLRQFMFSFANTG
jgi:hypothetical protein